MDMDTVLSHFFYDARSICGHEKTFHALFYHHLLEQGVPSTRIAREYEVGKKCRVDMMLFSPQTNGCVTQRPLCQVALEFKGGAHGNRNALCDTVKPYGPIGDIEKLAALRNQGLDAWFLCIDIPKVGKALNPAAVEAVAAQASAQGVHFAYFHQGADHFLSCRFGGGFKRQPLTANAQIEARKSIGDLFSAGSPLLTCLAHIVAEVRGSEDDHAAMLYSLLRRAGYGAQQLSLETYFSFANRGESRMHWRPDLSVFDASVAGRFNLYRNGDRRLSNDAFKLARLTALIEIKGSKATERCSDAKLVKIYSVDVEKLGRWKTLVRAAKRNLGVVNGAEPQYLFIGIDTRPNGGLASNQLAALKSLARREGVVFHYLARGGY